MQKFILTSQMMWEFKLLKTKQDDEAFMESLKSPPASISRGIIALTFSGNREKHRDGLNVLMMSIIYIGSNFSQIGVSFHFSLTLCLLKWLDCDLSLRD